MPRTALTVQSLPEGYDIDGEVLTWAAADAVNKNQFAHTGKELLLVRNEDVGVQVVTILSVADPYGRTGNASKSIAAAAFHMFQLFPLTGWKQTDGNVYVDAAVVGVKFAVIRIP